MTRDGEQGAGAERTTRELDAEALAALAHPLRNRLLRLLRVEGPATASGLAVRVGESSGLTSYHLRQLGAAGLVEEDPDRGSRRERWWRPTHDVTAWSPARFLADAREHRASQDLRRQAYQWQLRLLEDWLSQEAEWGEAWTDAAGFSDDVLELSPGQLRAMTDEIWAVVQRYRSDPPPVDEEEAGDAGGPARARVMWIQHVVPFAEYPL